MSNDNIKTVNMNANTLKNVFEDLNHLSKLMDDLIDLKEYCWSVKLNHEFKQKIAPFTKPRVKQTIEFIPFFLR